MGGQELTYRYILRNICYSRNPECLRDLGRADCRVSCPETSTPVQELHRNKMLARGKHQRYRECRNFANTDATRIVDDRVTQIYDEVREQAS